MKKQHLPTKICLVCERPFTWRKKWEKVWDEVKYCSEKCRRNRPKKNDNPIPQDAGARAFGTKINMMEAEKKHATKNDKSNTQDTGA